MKEKSIFVLPILVFALTLFQSCSSYVTPIYSGGNKGTVTYSPHGLGEMVEIRRRSAFDKITAYCQNRPYKIVKEELAPGNSREGEHQKSLASNVLIGVETVVFIDFECLEVEAKKKDDVK